MKYKAMQGFVKRNIAGEILLVPVGAATRDFNGMIMLNDTGEYLWELLAEAKTREELITEMEKEFEATVEEISADIDDFLKTGLEKNVILCESKEQ